MRNLCAKTVERPYEQNAYEVWEVAPGWRHYVLKKWQADDHKPFARWFCLVKSPFVPEGELGDVYAAEVMSGRKLPGPCAPCHGGMHGECRYGDCACDEIACAPA